MKELGSYSRQAHLECGKAAADYHVDVLLALGEEAKAYIEGADGGVPTVRHFDDKAALAETLCGMLREGDTVLFKASRAMKLEEIIASVYETLSDSSGN